MCGNVEQAGGRNTSGITEEQRRNRRERTGNPPQKALLHKDVHNRKSSLSLNKTVNVPFLTFLNY